MEKILKKIGQLQYEISCLGLDKETLTGVTIRTDELKELVKNCSIHNVVGQSELLSAFITEIKSEFADQNNENKKEEKYFSVTDKTGRSMKPYKLDMTHIKKTWDLSEEDWDTEETLGDFLEDCYIGDTWNTGAEKIECIVIK